MSLRSIALILWIAAGLVALELAAEYRAHTRGYDTLLFPRRASPEAATTEAAAVRYGPTEDFPFRSLIVPSERSPGATRYWVSSSSHAEDTLLAKSQIFPNVLARKLAERGRAAEVLNASHAGTLIAGNIREINAALPDWQPDYAILYQGSLEVDALSDRYIGDLTAGEPGSAEVDRGETQRPSSAVRLVESTTLYALLKVNVTARLTQSRVLADELGEEAMADFRQSLLDFVAAVREHGSKPVLCTFATMHDRDALGSFSADAVTSIFRFNVHLSLAGWVDAIETMNEIILAVGQEEGVPVVDIAGALGGQSDLFRDFVHFTAEGHERVAEVLARSLAPRAPSASPEEGG